MKYLHLLVYILLCVSSQSETSIGTSQETSTSTSPSTASGTREGSTTSTSPATASEISEETSTSNLTTATSGISEGTSTSNLTIANSGTGERTSTSKLPAATSEASEGSSTSNLTTATSESSEETTTSNSPTTISGTAEGTSTINSTTATSVTSKGISTSNSPPFTSSTSDEISTINLASAASRTSEGISTSTSLTATSRTSESTSRINSPAAPSGTSEITSTINQSAASSWTSGMSTSYTSNGINHSYATSGPNATLSGVSDMSSTSYPSTTPRGTSEMTSTSKPTVNSPTTHKKADSHSSPAVYVVDRVNIVTPITLDATIGKPFDRSLSNTSSPEFITLARDFKVMLEEAFRNLTGFQSIEIIAFENGSTKCMYNAVFIGVLNYMSTSPKEIEEVQQAINSSKIGNFSVNPGNMSMKIWTALETFKSDRCKVIRNPCRAGFFCDSTDGNVKCMSYCLSMENKQHPCQNGGHCYHDSIANTTNCRCAEDETYMYSGRYCQTKALSSTIIIIISASAGGGIILIFVIITVVLIVKLRKANDRKPPIDDKYERQSSYSMSEINIDRWNNTAVPRSRGSTMQNEYQSGLPDTKYVSGREHRVLKSDHGEEIYMYQPSMQVSNFRPPSLGPSDIETRSTRAESTYNYIDTEMTYQIKRPSVKVGYLNRI